MLRETVGAVDSTLEGDRLKVRFALPPRVAESTETPAKPG
jgi:hypothetical protein